MNSPQALTLSEFYQAQLQRLLVHQQAVEGELAKRNLQDLPLEKLFRLADIISRQLQHLLKAAAASSDVEVAILAAGQSGFQPPVPAELPSTQIKANQAAGKITAPDAPSSEFKVQSSTLAVQGSVPVSSPSTLSSPPSTPLEHCLMCGAPLPPLLPNGQRPDHYCKCGSPIHCAPGTSLLERCPHCGELQRAHGYNAIRQDNRCCRCGRDLPPLDPKSRTPWLPPARPQTPTPK